MGAVLLAEVLDRDDRRVGDVEPDRRIALDGSVVFA